MAPFGSSSDSNTIERGGLLTVLHIFFKKISDTLQIRTAEGDAAPKTGEGAQGRLQRIGAAPEPAAEGAAAEGRQQRARQQRAGSRGPAVRKTVQRGGRDAGTAGAKDNPAQQTVQRGGTARRAGRGKRLPGAADCATRRAERGGGRMLIVLRARREAR